MRHIAQGVLAHIDTEREGSGAPHLLAALCPDRLIFWEIKARY